MKKNFQTCISFAEYTYKSALHTEKVALNNMRHIQEVLLNEDDNGFIEFELHVPKSMRRGNDFSHVIIPVPKLRTAVIFVTNGIEDY